MPQTVLKNDLDVTGILTAGSFQSDADVVGTLTVQGATVIGTTNIKSPSFIIHKSKDTTITAASQTNADAIVTIPDIGDAADEFVMKDTVQTLTLKTLTAPINANPHTTYLVNPHNYADGTADWDISTGAGARYFINKVTNASGAVNCIVSAEIAPKIFINASGQALTVKTAAGTGITIANGKTAMVMSDGTNVIRLTTDA